MYKRQVGIVDSAGELVVEYKYDAWGKPVLVRTLTTAYDELSCLLYTSNNLQGDIVGIVDSNGRLVVE